MTRSEWKRARGFFKLDAAMSLVINRTYRYDIAYAQAEEHVARLESLFLAEFPLQDDTPYLDSLLSALTADIAKVTAAVQSQQTDPPTIEGAEGAEK